MGNWEISIIPIYEKYSFMMYTPQGLYLKVVRNWAYASSIIDQNVIYKSASA